MEIIIGDIRRTSDKTYEWRVPDYYSLPSTKCEDGFFSPMFEYDDALYQLIIQSQGFLKEKTRWVALKLCKVRGKFPTEDFSVTLRNGDGEIYATKTRNEAEYDYKFEYVPNSGWAWYLNRPHLLKLVKDGDLYISCSFNALATANTWNYTRLLSFTVVTVVFIICISTLIRKR